MLGRPVGAEKHPPAVSSKKCGTRSAPGERGDRKAVGEGSLSTQSTLTDPAGGRLAVPSSSLSCDRTMPEWSSVAISRMQSRTRHALRELEGELNALFDGSECLVR